MTLDEAIKHCEEKAKELRVKATRTARAKEPFYKYAECYECAKEHEQLAEWLKELKDYRDGKRTCENCKHERKSETDYPCSICRCNHPNKFEWRGEDK